MDHDINTSDNKLHDKSSTTLNSPHAPPAPSISDPVAAGTSSTQPLPEDPVKPIETEKTAADCSHEDEVKTTEEVPPERHSLLASLCADIDNFLSSFSDRKEATKEKQKDDENKQVNDDHKDEKIPEYVDIFLDQVHDKIIEYESNDGKTNLNQDFTTFLEAVNRVSKLTIALSEFISDPNLSKLSNRIGCIHQEAMSYLEDEFRLVLEDYKSNTGDKDVMTNNDNNNNNNNNNNEEGKTNESESEASVQEEDTFLGYGDDMIGNLNRIAKEMIAGGYESESCQVYMITRRHAFDEYLERVGFEKMSIDDVQKMSWDSLEREIPAWIKIFKDCATLYFSKERKLTEAVYSDSNSISSFLISNLVRGVMIQLLNFTEGMAMANRSAEKLFKFLDMYETLRDSIPAMDGLLPEECENDLIITEMTVAKSRIGEAAISIFCDLENSIKSDTGKTTVPGGAVHPLTRYTMNYLKYACEYMATLEEVFKKHAKIERADSTSRPDYQGEETAQSSNSNSSINPQDNNNNQPSPFSAQLMRLMDLLDSNLDAKAKLYKETALSNIFMMNNGRYIVQKIKGSPEIYQVVGESWCRRKSSDLRNYHKNYQRETWGKVLGCLGHEGLQSHGKVQKPVLKERFKNFNLLFDEIHRTQITWIVSDEQLQSELRISISAVVIPAYRSFLGRFSQYLDPGRQYEKYIKYQPEDIEDCIDELFEGNTSAIPRRRP